MYIYIYIYICIICIYMHIYTQYIYSMYFKNILFLSFLATACARECVHGTEKSVFGPDLSAFPPL